MAQLIFHVENQYIHRLDEFHVVARSNHYLYAEFTFSDDWVGVKTALFSVEADNGETITKPMLIGADGTCEVPHEVLEYDNSQLEVSAFCGNRVTANVAVVPVHESGYNDDSAPDDPTPDVYTQIMNRLANVEQIVVEKATEAESWAVGGTGTRTDEDIDNSKYYSEQASQSATNAAQSATSASESATSASGSASAASASAGIASEKATEATTAKSSIDIAVEEIRGIETNVRTYSQNAAHSAEEASETISVVHGYSETASQSARSASSSASDASASATSASGSASRASGYATNAQNYAAASERSMQSAATSERNTQGYASNAATSATNASGSETNAAASASQAADSASAASTSASLAASAKTDAETAQSAAEDAQTAAETAAQNIQASATQIATNTQNIATNTADIAQNTTDIADVKEDLSQLPSIENSTKTGVDLDVSDEDGNVLMRLSDGEVETKNFDSKSVAQVLTGSGIADLDVADPEGNVVLRVKNGHIMTKNFTSEDILARTTYITVKKDGMGDYSTLRGAIEHVNDEGDADPVEHPYVIQIYPGTYNLTDEYTQAEIEAADVSDYHDGFVGWMLNDGMSLVGVGNRESIILSCVLDTSIYNQQVRGNVSTLNTEGTVSLENLTVIAEHARYCVHDDFRYTGTGQYYRFVKNCNFIGKSLVHSPACTWGGGMSGQGENALYENCDFGTDYGHHFDASKGVTITFRNCRGRKIRLAERNKAVYHRLIIEDSDFDMISLMRPANVTAQHIMVEANGCEDVYVSCYEDDIILTGAITKTALTGLDVGTMVSIGSGSGNAYSATSDKTIADGIVVANDTYYSYIQRTGYINTRILGMTGFSLGDYITIDGNNKLVQGGTSSNAVGVVTFISNDSDQTDQGIGFIKLLVGGKNNG